MKAATGELNLTVITIVAVAAIVAFFWALWPTIAKTINNQWNDLSQDRTTRTGPTIVMPVR